MKLYRAHQYLSAERFSDDKYVAMMLFEDTESYTPRYPIMVEEIPIVKMWDMYDVETGDDYEIYLTDKGFLYSIDGNGILIAIGTPYEDPEHTLIREGRAWDI